MSSVIYEEMRNFLRQKRVCVERGRNKKATHVYMLCSISMCLMNNPVTALGLITQTGLPGLG